MTCTVSKFNDTSEASDLGFSGGSAVKNLPAMQETCVPSLGGEDPLEKGMAIHSGFLAWRIPWTELGYSPWGLKEPDTTERLSLFLMPRFFI